MEIRAKAFLKKLLLTLIVILIAGCASSNLTTSQSITPTPVSSSSLQPSKDQTRLAEPVTPTPVSSSCSWPPIPISDVPLSDYRWSSNHETIVYQQKWDSLTWFKYDLSSGKTEELKADPAGPTETPENGLEDWGIASYDNLFISPDRKYAIYTQPTDQQTLSVYLKPAKEKPAIFLGKMDGLIDQHIWIQGGRQIIFSIDWQSRWGVGDAHVYLVDLVDAKIKVLIPNRLKDGNTTLYDITLLGITPKEDKLLFVSYSGKDRSLRLFDIQNGSTSITNIHAPFALRWLLGRDQFWALGYAANASGVTSYIYDINDHSTHYVIPTPIKVPNGGDSVVISPDLKSIIFIEETYPILYKIDCSHIVQ